MVRRWRLTSPWAPTKKVYAVLDRHDERELKIVPLGLDSILGEGSEKLAAAINARLESASSKPSFRAAWKKRRALIPADGYYGWRYARKLARIRPPNRQIGLLHHPRDGSLMSMVKPLRNLARSDRPLLRRRPDGVRWTCTILTTVRPTATRPITTGCRCWSRRNYCREWLVRMAPSPGSLIARRTWPARRIPSPPGVNRVS